MVTIDQKRIEFPVVLLKIMFMNPWKIGVLEDEDYIMMNLLFLPCKHWKGLPAS